MQKAISGVQPSNKLTLGNYLGAIKQLIECQDKYEMYIFVADLHALSAPSYDAKTLHDNKISLISSYVALGLDLKKAHVFYQSDVLTHTQLC
jgi:tryptophanyl-tRNA synthetase